MAFIHFTEHGEMLPRGSRDAQDLYVFTGSAIEAVYRAVIAAREAPPLRPAGR